MPYIDMRYNTAKTDHLTTGHDIHLNDEQHRALCNDCNWRYPTDMRRRPHNAMTPPPKKSRIK